MCVCVGEGYQCARVCVRACVCVGGGVEGSTKRKDWLRGAHVLNKPCDLTRTPQLLIHVDNVGADTVIRVDGVASSEQ